MPNNQSLRATFPTVMQILQRLQTDKGGWGGRAWDTQRKQKSMDSYPRTYGFGTKRIHMSCPPLPIISIYIYLFPTAPNLHDRKATHTAFLRTHTAPAKDKCKWV